jgi:hypothetical protein
MGKLCTLAACTAGKEGAGTGMGTAWWSDSGLCKDTGECGEHLSYILSSPPFVFLFLESTSS